MHGAFYHEGQGLAGSLQAAPFQLAPLSWQTGSPVVVTSIFALAKV